ncbi:MAG: flagellar protein FlaG protein [Firmicutes bacterium]|nr:flagellar protein FlaG protein [Bacillota bacterium]
MEVKPTGGMDSVTSNTLVGDNAVKVNNTRPVLQETADGDGRRELSKQELNQMTQEMNSFMRSLNADLRFELHQKTKRLMVQLVDHSSQTVLKEFPPHEFLDTIAKISDSIGAFLDKKA